LGTTLINDSAKNIIQILLLSTGFSGLTGIIFDLFPEKKGQTPSPLAKQVLAFIFTVALLIILGDKTINW
jgi:hypothetical protein